MAVQLSACMPRYLLSHFTFPLVASAWAREDDGTGQNQRFIKDLYYNVTGRVCVGGHCLAFNLLSRKKSTWLMNQLCLTTSEQNCENSISRNSKKNLISRKLSFTGNFDYSSPAERWCLLPIFSNNAHSLFIRFSLLLHLQEVAPQNSL